MRLSRNHQQGFTLIELLVVVAIIGVLAALAIVNYLVALDKAKQKKTMADMNSIAQAWEARATDRGAYSAAGVSATAFDWPPEEISLANLKAMLSPTYIRPLAERDGWGYPFQFGLDLPEGDSQGAAIYAIRSPGRDGLFESEYLTAETTRFDCDIVYSNGAFVVSPAVH